MPNHGEIEHGIKATDCGCFCETESGSYNETGLLKQHLPRGE
jgi:hypothetical protein